MALHETIRISQFIIKKNNINILWSFHLVYYVHSLWAIHSNTLGIKKADIGVVCR
jgi:hypothetical protein